MTLAGYGKLVGAIGLGLQQDHDRAEMGYWIAVPHWNNGFTTEAARRVIDFGFEALTLERIFAQHFATNPASGRVMMKAGMHYEGSLRHHIKKNGGGTWILWCTAFCVRNGNQGIVDIPNAC